MKPDNVFLGAWAAMLGLTVAFWGFVAWLAYSVASHQGWIG